MIVTRRTARRIASGRQAELRLTRERTPPKLLAIIPITYREPNPGLGRSVAVEVCRVMILDVREHEDGRVLRFVVDRSPRPRLLARAVIAGVQDGYTDQPARAMPHEPEAVDEHTQALFTAESRRRDTERRDQLRAERRGLGFAEQLQLLEREARLRHVDVRDELRAIRRWTDPQARVRQLVRMRRKLEIAPEPSGQTS